MAGMTWNFIYHFFKSPNYWKADLTIPDDNLTFNFCIIIWRCRCFLIVITLNYQHNKENNYNDLAKPVYLDLKLDYVIWSNRLQEYVLVQITVPYLTKNNTWQPLDFHTSGCLVVEGVLHLMDFHPEPGPAQQSKGKIEKEWTCDFRSSIWKYCQETTRLPMLKFRHKAVFIHLGCSAFQNGHKDFY